MASKKDYQAVAAIIYRVTLEFPAEAPKRNASGAIEWPGVLGVVAFELGVMFRADNRAFDARRFEEACETGCTRGMKQVGAGIERTPEDVAQFQADMARIGKA